MGSLGSQVGKAAHVACPDGQRRQVALHFLFRDRLGGRECSLRLEERLERLERVSCCCCCCCTWDMGAEVRLAGDVAASFQGERGSGVLGTRSKILCGPRAGHWQPMLASAMPMLLPSVFVDIAGMATAPPV